MVGRLRLALQVCGYHFGCMSSDSQLNFGTAQCTGGAGEEGPAATHRPAVYTALLFPNLAWLCRCNDKLYWQSKLGVPCAWHHTESGHGKGRHDGAAGLDKAAARREQALAGGKRIVTAEDFYCFLCTRRQSATRRFWWVPGGKEEGAVNHEPSGYGGADGMSQRRSFYTDGETDLHGNPVVYMRLVTCSCTPCR